MNGAGPMPSRELGERWPNLIPVGGHPAVDMPQHVVEAAARAAERPPYAPTRGLPALREAIAAEHGVDPDRNVLVTLGGMQGLYLAAQRVRQSRVTHAPAFFFPQLVEAAGGSCAVAYDWDELAAAVEPRDNARDREHAGQPDRPRLPAGRPRRDRGGAARADALLLSDEAYAGVVYDGLEHRSPASHPELARAYTRPPQLARRRWAMAAWRVGYAVGPARAIDALAAELQWQALAIDGVAQSAAARRADRAARLDRGGDRRAGGDAGASDRGGERGRPPLLRPGELRLRLGRGRRRRGRVERPARARPRDPRGRRAATSTRGRRTCGSRSAGAPRRARRCSSSSAALASR